MNDAPKPTFESALSDLEKIVRDLENGTTNLDDSLAAYEKGVGLLKACYQQLRDAEQRILNLTGIDEDGRPVFTPFEHTAAVEADEPAKQGRKPPKRQSESS